MRKLTGAFFLISVAAMQPAIAVQECTANLTLVGDGVESADISSAQVEAFDRSSNASVTPTRAGLQYHLAVPGPERLFRRVDVRSEVPAQKLVGDGSLYLTWPCESIATVYLFVGPRSGGLAAEVVGLQRQRDIFSAPDTLTAARYFARALAIAEARYAFKPRLKHQLDIIATYHALATFHRLAEISEVSLAFPPRLVPIATWHIELLSSANLDGLEYIGRDGKLIAQELQALVRFYSKMWNKLNEMKNLTEKLDGLQRLRRAIEDEPDTNAILVGMKLSRDELLNSTSQVAALVQQQQTQALEKSAALVAAQIEVLSEAIKSPTFSAPAKARFRADQQVLRSVTRVLR